MNKEEEYKDIKQPTRPHKMGHGSRPKKGFIVKNPVRVIYNNQHPPQMLPHGRIRTSSSGGGGGRRKAYASTKGHKIG